MAAADSDKRLSLIKENLAEVLNEEIIKKILDEGQHPKIYWGKLATPVLCACVVLLGNADTTLLQAPRRQAGRIAATLSPPSRSLSSSPPGAM